MTPLTKHQLDYVTSEAAVKQQLDKMIKRGVITPNEVPSQFRSPHLGSEVTKIAADVVDAIKWHDARTVEIESLKTEDVKQAKPWLDELRENFAVFDVSPNMTHAEAQTILSELSSEIENLGEGGYGPEARDYLFRLRRELEVIIENINQSV